MTLPVAMLAVSAIGAGVSAAGSISQGNAAFKSGQYQAAVNEQNATYSEAQGADAIARGKVEGEQIRRNAASTASSQRAILAGLGQVVDLGSAGQITADTAQMGELDYQTSKRNAQVEALGFQEQARQQRAGATLNRMAGASARTAGFMNAGATLLTTAGNAGSNYYYQTKGIVPSFKGG